MAGGGDENGTDQLALAYDELRRLAGRYLRHGGADQTLQPTALVHEAWLRLAGNRALDEITSSHVAARAARAMRHVLVDRARRRGSAKRGGDWQRVALEAAPPRSEATALLDAVVLNQAIDALAASHAELAELAELRLLAGRSLADAAAILDWPLSTAKKRWQFTIAWLARAVRSDD